MNIKILLADNHKIVRKGICSLIEIQPDMKIIAEADTGRMLLDQVRKHKPDVVITEILLPELNGIDATLQICEKFNTINVIALNVIALTILLDKKSVERMLGAGAKGYLTKECSPEELVTAIRRVHEGHIYLCQRTEDIVAEDLVLFLYGKKTSFSSDLTPREREVTQLYAECWSTGEIADHLNVSKITVATHRRNIDKKLGVKGIVGITKYAIRENMTTLY